MVTNRDAWVYNYDPRILAKNVKRTINFYNSELRHWQSSEKNVSVDAFVTNDHLQISWSSNVKQNLKRGIFYKYDKKCIVKSLYRPFSKQHIYFSNELNSRQGKTPKVFPLQGGDNLAICVSMDRNNQAPLMCDTIPDIQLVQNNKIFPRYSYDNGEKIDNINPYFVRKYREHYRDPKINADALFYHIYALLHAGWYREKYKNSLSKETPRLPFVQDFWKYVKVGKNLAKLHVNYEQVKPYTKLKMTGLEQNNLRVQKMKHPKNDKRERF